VDAVTDRYDAAQLERELNATVVTYRRWLNNQDQWTGFDDDRQQARLRKLAGEVADLVQELTSTQRQESEVDQDEYGGKVETGDGASFETYAYFEEGQFIVADDGDEEWVVSLGDISRHETGPGILFPDKDGSHLRFVPSDPDGFHEALGEAQQG
jgi:hypothetical protein